MPAERTPRIVAALSASGLPERGLMSIAPSIGEGDLLTCRYIGCAADDGRSLAVADVHGGKHQAVGVGVRIDAEHMAYDEPLRVEVRADNLHIADLVARHCETVRQFVGGNVELDVVSEPG